MEPPIKPIATSLTLREREILDTVRKAEQANEKRYSDNQLINVPPFLCRIVDVKATKDKPVKIILELEDYPLTAEMNSAYGYVKEGKLHNSVSGLLIYVLKSNRELSVEMVTNDNKEGE